MRKLVTEHGTVVEVRGRRAVVRIDGRYVGTARRSRGRWTVPGSTAAYSGPADVADALAYGDAA